MELGMVGLGRMGGNMARRLLGGGHRIFAYDPVKESVQATVNDGAKGASSLADLVKQLTQPRAVWVMVPAGEATEQTVGSLRALLSRGDIVVDGGNSYYRDSQRRAAELAGAGITFLDVGTSGGIWGLKEGYCLMVGGDEKAYRRLEPAFQALALAADRGYVYCGPSGAGHFVKMVHNGIEYGLMQAYAEGFELLQAKSEFKLDVAAIARTWRYGSVVRSWLLDLTAEALPEDPGLESLAAHVDDSGEGRWTVKEGVDLAVPLPVISAALDVRFRSRQSQPLSARVLAAMRQQFGGHPVQKAGGKA
jgi:6-phosphogluconate dehydrogenase